MSILDIVVGFLAPHACSGCGEEGAVLCPDCINRLPPVPERCYRCHKLSALGTTCRSCRSTSKLGRVRPATLYAGYSKEAIRRLKYDGAQAAAKNIAMAMTKVVHSYVAEHNPEVLLVPVPTTTGRKRERGYDQAQLIARELSKQTGLSYRPVLRRHGHAHQVGSSRRVRLRQLTNVFRVKPESVVRGRHIILVDDVMTTGGTLEAAAKVLREAGAKRVDGAVFAVA